MAAKARTVARRWLRCGSCEVESTMPVQELRRGPFGLLRVDGPRHALCVVCTAVAGRPVITPLRPAAPQPVAVRPARRPLPAFGVPLPQSGHAA